MAHLNNLVYEFGPYRLDVAERVLWRSSQPVALTPKSLDILLVLLENSGHIVEKSHLIEETWPGTFVEEGNLAQNIFVLRKVLGEGDQGVEYIETIPRRGYRFVAPVKCVPSTTDLLSSPEGRQQPVIALPIDSLAVLPFINTDGDSKVEYLADGLTEGIINSLSQVSRLRVMSSNCVARYRGREADAQNIGKELDVGAVLVGKVQSLGRRLVINVELVDVANGWQLWGETYDAGFRALLDVQEEIARQISGALRFRLTGVEEQQLTKRYTENPDAYQAYLKGRYYWGKYTSESLHKATEFFRRAIDLDPNYSLAYAGIVDCYLRLATNYIPPSENPLPAAPAEASIDIAAEPESFPEAIGLRYEWDRKTAERELRRAAELNTNYPAAHQWSAAYKFAHELYEKRAVKRNSAESDSNDERGLPRASESSLRLDGNFASQFRGATLTPDEEVQVFCTIAREQIDTGNYEAACAVLERWWTLGEWPRLEGLCQSSSADLLFTAGALAGWLASSRKVPKGQKHAEALLSGAIAVFEQLGLKTRAAEARIELAYCYYREGVFDLARDTIVTALEPIPPEERALRAVALVRLAIIERQSGRLTESLMRLQEAGVMVETVGPLVSGRYHHELGTTLKELGADQGGDEYFEKSIQNYERALREFQAIGNHRYSGVQENNRGLLLLNLNRLNDSETHVARARRIFEAFADDSRCGQVDETLARIHLARNRLEAAEDTAARAVRILQSSGEESFLAEALGTHGLALCKLGRFSEAKRALDRALQLAQACGDEECAERVLLILVEEIFDDLDPTECEEVAAQLKRALSRCRKKSTQDRLQRSYEMISRLSSS